MKQRQPKQPAQGSPSTQPGPVPPPVAMQPAKEPFHLEVKDLLLPLVGALWAWGGLILPLVLELNKIRDRVLGMDPAVQLKPEFRLLLLENDWLMLGYFLVFLCVAFGLLCAFSPKLLARERRTGRVWIASWFVGGVAIVTGVFWEATSFRDCRAMRQAIALSSTSSIATNGASTNSVGTIVVGTNNIGTNTVTTAKH